MRKRPASPGGGLGCGCATAHPAASPSPVPSRPSRGRRLRFHSVLVAPALLLVVQLLLMAAAAPKAQALSPSKMIASFASQQRRTQGYHGSASGRMAAATRHRHGPIPPKQPSQMGGIRQAAAAAPLSAFIASSGNGGDEIMASWPNSGGAGAQVWQPPRLSGFSLGNGGPGDMAGSMGVSGLGGMAAGYVAKRFGRMLSFACGFVLVSMKVAEELGYISVNWAKIEDDTRSLGRSLWGKGGTVRRKAEHLAHSWQKELGQNAGIAGSFAAGFAYGFRA